MSPVGCAARLLAVGWLALAGWRASADEARAPEPLLFPVLENGRMGFINPKGELVIPLQFKMQRTGLGSEGNGGGVFREGRTAVQIDGSFGFIDENGRVVIAPIYEQVETFSDGLVAVQKKEEGNPSGWCYLDRNGTVVIPGPFDYACQFTGGVAFVREEGKDAEPKLIDRTGHTIGTLPSRVVGVSSFDEDGLARIWVDTKSNKSGQITATETKWIDRQGRVMNVPPMPDVVEDFHNGLARMSTNLKTNPVPNQPRRRIRWGFVDRIGTFRIRPRFEDAGNFHDGLAPVKSGGGWGYVDTVGREAVAAKWDAADMFSEERGPVQHDGMWGFVDRAGKVVIEPRFDEVQLFAGGLALVWIGDEMGYVDPNGRIVWGLREFAGWSTINEISYIRLLRFVHDQPEVPTDQLVLRRDGTAEYIVERKHPGRFRGPGRVPQYRLPGIGHWREVVSPYDFRQLARLLWTQKFFEVKDPPWGGADVMPSVIGARRDNGESKGILYGDYPLELWGVDRAIESVAASIDWTKVPAGIGRAQDGKTRPHRRR